MQEAMHEDYLLSAFPLEGGEMVRVTCVALADGCCEMCTLPVVKTAALIEAFQFLDLEKELAELRFCVSHGLPLQIPLQSKAATALAHFFDTSCQVN